MAHQRSTNCSRMARRRAEPPRRCAPSSAIRLRDVICSVTLSSRASPSTRASRSGSSDSARSVESSDRNSSKSSEPSPSLSALLNMRARVALSEAEEMEEVPSSRDACSWNSCSCSLWSSLESIASNTSRARSVLPALTCSSSSEICCCCSSTVACSCTASALRLGSRGAGPGSVRSSTCAAWSSPARSSSASKCVRSSGSSAPSAGGAGVRAPSSTTRESVAALPAPSALPSDCCSVPEKARSVSVSAAALTIARREDADNAGRMAKQPRCSSVSSSSSWLVR
mmetsp:Transcript_29804/g.69529  ORF Transcript_29804/g.69529 Transcript_29804/m.69529 type:complete len:284 (-) Transcript_29804:113-964(-)